MERRLKIYYTSDTHGYLFPTDYVNKEEKPMGVLSCSKSFEKDGNTLILDGGDTIQGSAFAKYMWENQADGCAISEVFNTAGYDYVTLGNHDFNYDYKGAHRYLSHLNAACLLANVIDHKGELGLKPYVIHTLENGLKVGLIGLVTDYVSLWEKPEHLQHLEILDTFETAQRTLEEVRPLCDITIGIYHGGFEADLQTGKTLAKGKENVGYRMCKELAFDVLLTAHQHMPVEGTEIHGTYVLQLPSNAVKYAKLEVVVGEKGKVITADCLTPESISLNEVPEALVEMQEQVQRWLDQKVGRFSKPIEPLSKLELALQGSKLADFCNKVQLAHTGADFSCTSLGNNPIGFNEEVTTRDIMAAYQFPNTIKVLEIDEATLKKALERSAQYYTLKGGEIVISECFVSPKVEHYNYDFFAGFNYTFDISKPIGERVTSITVNGKPLENRKYTIAMSDYRATGTGGYEFYSECPLVREYGVDIQELVIEYIRSHECIRIDDKINFEVKF
ncbi:MULTISPECIES: bifunctional metallophosphatase/5'-nucleotidase [Cellulosilyticum]|uniref:5'-Nucleotidase domain-containing protein n=1 Tax=Cellulosilyticum lentocellum (strain ATCC 49066 / DSM 5427 / NCIMB 11756 / RHM5) TaxID=642492 RepID=F2JPZ8_CELLD|nr:MULTISPECIES: bifunctional UDP-sugar hydrolase/5'-nucleotidase [Cellulosilyticum]ADZ84933.1 5'-Nucleotidase domain-containing protein [Cellulosilyticum lentocellum DSM 5427]QEH70394.1 bifunctional metallophosphatase/5'-nucleotidase [Cellulosilyticum sp. WCF-2]